MITNRLNDIFFSNIKNSIGHLTVDIHVLGGLYLGLLSTSNSECTVRTNVLKNIISSKGSSTCII